MEIILNNLEETQKFGEKLGSILKEGDILCLNGDLGAGKTTLTKSIGSGLGVDEYITSPTFALINEYRGRIPVYHIDVYRLENVEEIDDLGFDEYIYGSGVTIIEWAERIRSFLPKDRIILDIRRGDDENSRRVSLSGDGERYRAVLRRVKEDWLH